MKHRTSFIFNLLVAPIFAFLIGAAPIQATGQTYGIIGDAGMVNDGHIRVRESMERSGIQDLILPGDNLYQSRETYEKIWNPWRQRGFEFSITAIGNHNGGYKEEMRYFDMPAEAYSVVRDQARFIVLNSDNEKTVAQQISFLVKSLRDAREKFVFLVYHHPTFTVSEHHDWKEKEGFQKELRQVLQKYGSRITALIVGHDHIASLLSINGLPMIVSGAVWNHLPTRPRAYRDGPFDVKTAWLFRDGPHWARLDIDSGRPEVWLNFVSARDERVVCSARIAPRPILMNPNCASSTARLSPVRVPSSPAIRKTIR